LLEEGRHPGGTLYRTWDGRDEAGLDVPSGVYFVRLETGAGAIAKKVVLLR
jgi:hypothetical protein